MSQTMPSPPWLPICSHQLFRLGWHDLPDLCMGSGAGHHSHIELSICWGNIVTVNCLPRGMLKARLDHNGAPHGVLRGLLRVYILPHSKVELDRGGGGRVLSKGAS